MFVCMYVTTAYMGKVCTRHVQRHNSQTIKGTGKPSRAIEKQLDCQIVAIVVVTDHNIVHVQLIKCFSHTCELFLDSVFHVWSHNFG